MLRFASLASGSKGNCLAVQCGGTTILIDCGLGPRKAARRLRELGIEPDTVSALLVTHEHDDHAGGVAAFAAAHGIPVWMTRGTQRALARADQVPDGLDIRFLDGRSALGIGDLQIRPFTVPHDAAEPVQYVISDGALRLGVLTDIGMQTPHVIEALSGCDGLVLECNHELEQLWAGDYPRWLKERISGPLGHIDNASAAALLGALDRTRLQHVIAAHLSDRNNRPEAARAALATAMGCAPDWIGLARQESGFDWRELR
jgi:phosphoribosyl 1,2-cyclic phosphodiesterase